MRIRSALLRALTDLGHAVSSAPTAMAGLQQAIDGRPDLVVLDLGLPDLDGGELLRMLRAVSRVPVIVATARDDDPSMVSVLDAGADDYIVKPYSAVQLDARIRAVLRRATETEAEAPVEVGDLVIRQRARTVALGGVPVDLTPKEFDLLVYLAARAGEVVSKRELLIEVLAAAVRRIGQDGRCPSVLVAAQARRVRAGTAVRPHGARGRREAARSGPMRRQILALVAATTALVLVAFLVPLALVIRQVAAERAVSAARQEIDGLVAIAGVAPRPVLEATVDTLNAEAENRSISIYLSDGPVLGADVPRTERVRLAAQPQSFSYELDGGLELLIGVAGAQAAANGQGTAVIRAFVPPEQLTAGVRQVWLILAALGLVLLGVAIAVADRLATSLVGPVRRLADTASRLEAGELTARAQVSGPREIHEVGGALDRLAARIGELLVAERERVADISHRLRTPLTALRLEAGSLQDPEERTRLGATAEDLRRVVDDVIAAARLPVRDAVAVECDAVAAVRVRAEFWKVLADDQDRAMSVDLPPGEVLVRLAAAELDAAVDALLGNVFAHTPEGVPIRITVAPRPVGGCRLVVADGGPGLPDAAVLARGESGAGSTGLGLDIARRAAEASGGRLTFGRSIDGGAEVTLDLGPPAD